MATTEQHGRGQLRRPRGRRGAVARSARRRAGRRSRCRRRRRARSPGRARRAAAGGADRGPRRPRALCVVAPPRRSASPSTAQASLRRRISASSAARVAASASAWKSGWALAGQRARRPGGSRAVGGVGGRPPAPRSASRPRCVGARRSADADPGRGCDAWAHHERRSPRRRAHRGRPQHRRPGRPLPPQRRLPRVPGHQRRGRPRPGARPPAQAGHPRRRACPASSTASTCAAQLRAHERRARSSC